MNSWNNVARPLRQGRSVCALCHGAPRVVKYEAVLERWICRECWRAQAAIADGRIEPPDAADRGEL